MTEKGVRLSWEVDEWPVPARRRSAEVKAVIDSICDNKVQQFQGEDSDEDEENVELNAEIHTARAIKRGRA